MKTNNSFKKGHPGYYTATGEDHCRYRHGRGSTKQRDPLYRTWANMKRRCYNKKSKDYARYGALGVTVCNRWHDFINFLTDMGPTFKVGLSLERNNNTKGYSPDNCRWIPLAEQSRNRKNVVIYEYLGKNMSIPELAKLANIDVDTMFARIKRYGWTPERAVTTPIRSKTSPKIR